jgi:hypothetical protein
MFYIGLGLPFGLYGRVSPPVISRRGISAFILFPVMGVEVHFPGDVPCSSFLDLALAVCGGKY